MFNFLRGYTTATDKIAAAFRIAKIMDDLDADGQRSVLAWLNVHYSGNVKLDPSVRNALMNNHYKIKKEMA